MQPSSSLGQLQFKFHAVAPLPAALDKEKKARAPPAPSLVCLYKGSAERWWWLRLPSSCVALQRSHSSY